MSFKKNILKKYLDTDIHYIIWHDWWKYTKIIIVYTWILVFLFLSYIWIAKISSVNILNYINIIFWVIWAIIYIRFILQFMDIYLDSVVITKIGIIIFKWEWLLRYTSETIDWPSVQAVEDAQSWLLDMMLNKWDIVIKRWVEEYRFNDISHPSKQKNDILMYKDKFETKPEPEKEPEPELDKFDVLVETLGEVILDYVKKSK